MAGIHWRRLALPISLVLSLPAVVALAEVSAPDTTETLTLRKVQCAAPCQRAGRLTLTDREIVFEMDKKNRLTIPFERIRSVQCFRGEKQDRPIVEPSGGGLFWGFVKHKKAGFVFDYTNERGGTMGLVLLTDPKDEPAFRDWLGRFGVPLRDLTPDAPAKPSP